MAIDHTVTKDGFSMRSAISPAARRIVENAAGEASPRQHRPDFVAR